MYLNFQSYTQYIPLSIYELQTWMGAPSIYVYDCSNAAVIVKLFEQFAEQHEEEWRVSSMHMTVWLSVTADYFLSTTRE